MSRSSPLSVRIIILLIFLWGLWTLRLDAMFFGDQDAFRTWMPAAALNYDTYDVDEIGLMVVRDRFVPDDLDMLNRYSHHPPLAIWLPALFTNVAGNNEVALRFTFPAAMMIAVATFYALVCRLYDNRVGFWACIFFGIPPMISYFQPSYGHDPLGFMALMLFALVTFDWLRRRSWVRFLALISLTIFACWTAWPAVVFVGVIGMFAMLVGTWQHRVGVVLLGIIAVLSITVMILLYQQWWSEAFSSLMEAYVWRSSTAGRQLGSESFSLWMWIGMNLFHLVYYGSLGIFLLSLIGAFLMGQQGNSYSHAFTLTLLAASLVYMLAFRNATFIHNYYKAFLMPTIAIAAGYAVVHGRNAEIRFLRPVIDAIIFLGIVQSLWVLSSMVATTHEPSLERVIKYINNQPDDQVIVVNYADVTRDSEYAVEYYTEQDVRWNIPLEEISQEESILYIYCDASQESLHATDEKDLPAPDMIDDRCAAYTFNTKTP